MEPADRKLSKSLSKAECLVLLQLSGLHADTSVYLLPADLQGGLFVVKACNVGYNEPAWDSAGSLLTQALRVCS